MSHVEPGWYRDPSGRFAGRFYDGRRWTEHVADAHGQWGIDHRIRRPRPAAGQPAPDTHGRSATAGFRLTVGHVATVVGGLLVTLSVVAFDFVRTHTGSSPLSDVADVPPQVGVSPPLATYATLGRWLVLAVVLLAVMAVLPLPARLHRVPKLPVIVALVCAGFLVWSGLASFGRFHLDVVGLGGAVGVTTSLDASPAVGAVLGLVGYVGMAGGQFLRRPIGRAR